MFPFKISKIYKGSDADVAIEKENTSEYEKLEEAYQWAEI